MSDEDETDEVLVVKKPKFVHYGSLAESESRKARDAPAPMDYSNISVSREYLELDRAPDTREEMLAEFDRRRKARSLTLPTDDAEVKGRLRQLGQPICLFGEDKPERRERLRTLLSLLSEEEKQQFFGEQPVAKPERRGPDTTWYHEGTVSLKNARIFIAKFSLPRSRARLDEARLVKEIPVTQRNLKLQEKHKWLRSFNNLCSQIGDTRPLSFCQFSPNSKLLATASWTGLCKLWSIPDCENLKTFRGHTTQVCCVAFHPQSTLTLDPHALNIASSAQDGTVKLWTLEDEEPLGEIEGHAPYRVNRVAFHPSGRFLATACFDNSWRLFDLEENEEILFQEGHSQPVYDIAFQQDGAVALTGGMDSYGRAWDLRTGRCVMFLEGHLKGILAVAFSPNGYTMGTGSQDNSCKIWDLRMRKCVYTIPAHQSLVSRLRFEGNSGEYLVTSSYDNTIKIWTHPGWLPLKTLKGHDSRVMSIDIAPNNKVIASTSFDRTFKLWSAENSSLEEMECCNCLSYLLIAVLFLAPILWKISLRFRYVMKMALLYLDILASSSFTLICSLMSPGDPLNYRFIKSSFLFLTSVFNIKYEVRGLENYVDEPSVIVCNHQSSVDLIGMMQAWPSRCVALMKSSLIYAGTVGIAAKLCGSVLIDRFNKGTAINVMGNAADRITSDKVKIWMFPEGTRNHEGEMLPFKKGAFHLAIQAQVPVVPVVFSSYKPFYCKAESKFLSHGFVIISILPAIPTVGLTKDDVNSLTDKVRGQMMAEFDRISPEAAKVL